MQNRQGRSGYESGRFLAEIRKIIGRNRSTVLAGLLTVLIGTVSFQYVRYVQESSLAPLSTINGLRAISILGFLVLLVFGEYRKYTIFRVVNRVLVPATALLIVVYFHVNPWGADALATEDQLLEDMQFLFLALGSAMFAFTGARLFRSHQQVAALLAGVLAFLFFVIAGEEVSWFQRVFNLQSPNFFVENNWQNETNLHNLNTFVSQPLYYFGVFLLVTLIPFFHDPMSNFLEQIGMDSVTVLLPPQWLIATFAIGPAFVLQGEWFSYYYHLFIVVGCLVLLVGLHVRHYLQRDFRHLSYVVFQTVVFLLIAWYFLLQFKHEELGIRYSLPTEYQEFYIAWGIAAYGVSVGFQVHEWIRDEPLSADHELP